MGITELQDYKRQLIDINRKTQEELDKSFITLSTILLGISFTLRQQLYLQKKVIEFHIVFTLEFFAFLICILLVLSSYFLSMHYTQKSIDLIDLHTEINLDTELEIIYEKSKITAKANSWAAIFFVIGIILLSVFAFLNFG